MNVSPSLRSRMPELTRSIWAIALGILVAGGLIVIRPFEDTIGTARERARIAAARATAEENALAERTRISAAADRIRADLRDVALRTDAGALTTGLLLDTQQLAKRNSVRLVSLRPEAAIPAAAQSNPVSDAANGRSATSRTLGERADTFEVRLRGRFADVAAAIRGLSLMPTLAQVLDAKIERYDAATGAGAVEATVRLAAIRFAPAHTPLP